MEKQAYNPTGIYGWRKRFLYCLILLLVFVILINIALTAWILVVLQFNINGMGVVSVTNDGLKVNGEAEFLGSIYTSNVEAIDQNTSLSIEAHKAIEMEVDDSKVGITPLEVRVTSHNFTVESAKSSIPLLSISENGDTIIKSSLTVEGRRGADVNEVRTDLLTSPQETDLNIESSANGGLSVIATDTILLESLLQSIELLSGGNLIFNSTGGKVELAASTVLLKGLPLSQPVTPNGKLWNNVYSVCVCPTGKLYRVPANYTEGCNISSNTC